MSIATFPSPVHSASVQRTQLVRVTATPHLSPVPSTRPQAVTVDQTSKARALLTARNVTVVIIAIIVIFVLRLLISVATDANAYAIAEKSQLSQNLTRDAQFLQEQLNVLNSPQNLSAVAEKLGMISNSNPAYLRISDGKMWGNPQVADTGVDDRTAIANVLLSTMLPASASQGVATDSRPSSGAESAERSGLGSDSGSSTIPAPNTH